MILSSSNKLNPINQSILINIKTFLKISENLSEKYNDQIHHLSIYYHYYYYYLIQKKQKIINNKQLIK